MSAPEFSFSDRVGARVGGFGQLLWAFAPGALLALAIWALTVGHDVDWSNLKHPKALAARGQSINLFFWGGGFASVLVRFVALRNRSTAQRNAAAWLLWLTAWFVWFGVLGFFSQPLWRWVFFTLPLSWFAARLSSGAGRKKTKASGATEEPVYPKPLFSMLAGAAFATYCLFSLTRHYSFGSGSWDMGCYNHNIWLLAHLKPLTSTVLGDVNFMGDHFVPILALFAPLAYTGVTGVLLVVQSAAVALGVMPIYAIAKKRGLPVGAALAIAVGYLFAVGTQTMINFDFHEIALVPASLLFGFWAIESGKKRLFLTAAVLIFCSKESAIVYAGALGFYAFLFGPGMRKVGLAVFLFCVPAFFLVVGVLQPALLEGGPQGMIHLARFKAFGATAPEAFANMLANPGKAFFMLFAPGLKAKTWLVTLGTFGFLPLLAPEVFVVMMPNLMERFLSNKQEMWGLGFHYSVVWISLCTYAALVAASRLKQAVAALALKADMKHAPATFNRTLAVWLLLCWAGTLMHGTKAPEFKSLQKSYFAKAEQIPINRKAVAFVPQDAKVVAQNHFLPFLAFRQYVWQPQDRFFGKANYAILNPTEGSWPHSRKHIEKWIYRLKRDAQWRLVFSEGTTVIFSREAVPEVSPSPQLRRVLPRIAR